MRPTSGRGERADSTTHVEELVRIGERVAPQVKLAPFGSLLTA